MKHYIHPIHCNRTGVRLGLLTLELGAGHVPYLSHWNEQVAYHPLFSLTQHKLINFIKDEWNRLAKEITNDNVSETESQTLRVGFVAILHSLGSIKQDSGIVCLPELRVVQSNLESLVALAGWQNYLDSKRFAFPFLHISKLNANAGLEDVDDYLKACWNKKEEYEKGLDDVREQEKLRIAEKAILALRNGFIKPPSKKLLWQWVKGHLPAKWQPDAEGWMGTLFLGSGATALEFDKDEIELMEEIIVSNCPIGSGVMHAVRERIQTIHSAHTDHYDTFTIEEDGQTLINTLRDELFGSPEPSIKDYPSKTAWIVARAKWQLANPPINPQAIRGATESARAKLADSNNI